MEVRKKSVAAGGRAGADVIGAKKLGINVVSVAWVESKRRGGGGRGVLAVVVEGAGGRRGGLRRRRKLAGFEGFLAVEIVDLTLLGVAENIVGFGDSFEFGFGFGLVNGVLVGVPYASESLIRFLQIVVAGVAIHFEYVVVIHAHNNGVVLGLR